MNWLAWSERGNNAQEASERILVHSLKNNSGSFVSLRIKYNPNQWNEYYEQVLLTDIHWGQQLTFDNHFSFNYHIGLGYATHLDSKYSDYNSIFPNMGFGIFYHFGK